MHTFMNSFEELWISITFAEAGVAAYSPVPAEEARPTISVVCTAA